MRGELEQPGHAMLAVRVGVLVVGTLILASHAVQYLNFLVDDALIPAVYANRLLSGEGLTWSDGTRVEGYSSLLWLLLLSAVGSVEPNLVTALRVLGFASSLATMVVLAFWQPRSSPWGGALAVCMFAAAGPVALWTVGGLEAPLVGLLLAAASAMLLPLLDPPVADAKRFLAPGFVFGWLCLARPDAPLFCVAAGAAVLLSGGSTSERLRRATMLAVGPLVALVGQLVFRLLYMGTWVPNTALIKITPSATHLSSGWGYVLGGWTSLAGIAIVGGLAVAVLMRYGHRPAAAYLILALLGWSIYWVGVGGDIFEGYRHFVPVVVLLAVAVAHAGGRLPDRLAPGVSRAVAAASIAAVLVGCSAVQQRTGEAYRHAREQSWLVLGREVSRMLADAFADRDPLLATNIAGSIPYWTRMRCIDMLGLNDPHIARSRRADLGQGELGHEHGDGAYILSREPDLILPCGPWGGVEPCYRSEREMLASGELERLYVPVDLRRPEGWPPQVHSTVWLRRDSPALGIRTGSEETFIPAYLFETGDDHPTVASVGESGPPLVALEPGRELRIAGLTPPRPVQGSEYSVWLNPPVDAEVELIPSSDGRLELRIVPREQGVLAAAVIRALDGPPIAATQVDRSASSNR